MMSRSGYIDDPESNWSLICWRGAVNSAIKGKRGQALLKELVEALDAMPEKRLIPNELIQEGEVCALGALAIKRNLDISNVDPEDYVSVAGKFNAAEALVREIVYINDEWFYGTAEERWRRMREWAVKNIKAEG